MGVIVHVFVHVFGLRLWVCAVIFGSGLVWLKQTHNSIRS